MNFENVRYVRIDSPVKHGLVDFGIFAFALAFSMLRLF